MPKVLSIDEKIELIKRNTEEIITLDSLKELIKEKKNPRVYCGYELSGPMHLGHFVTITKLLDLQKAGFKIVILLADVHTMLNRKGDFDGIKKEVNNWKKTMKAIGINAEIVLGSDFEFDKNYQLDVMKLSQNSSINRGLRSMQEIARDVENATISQLWYPLMQVADIKHLNVDVALGGIEQRKVHMIGKDMSKVIGYDFVAIHTPLITSLKGPGQKMSKSIPGSGISVTDSLDEIKKAIKSAYCPEKTSNDNPILQIFQLVIFPRFDVEIKRQEKFGGNIKFKNYQDLEKIYFQGKIHPLDLKEACIEYLWKITESIRKNWK
ncbi:tyrosine--tRNA ligase [Candidatus Pacearchaeota archaeon]|nr:tyrosine--tRNA ligase [Candidatus Pacearchaeota archaeon]